MTDYHAGYVVTLECDRREDAAEDIITALRMIKGVASVEPVRGGAALDIAEERARMDIRERLAELMRDL